MNWSPLEFRKGIWQSVKNPVPKPQLLCVSACYFLWTFFFNPMVGTEKKKTDHTVVFKKGQFLCHPVTSPLTWLKLSR